MRLTEWALKPFELYLTVQGVKLLNAKEFSLNATVGYSQAELMGLGTLPRLAVGRVV
ncbi:hypothetical protein VN12_10830 [Pirellula sp. SH-Sr6A]|uniref:hypothetical protein n=1 Tax=Pirellula sp. SH-Sr6A TaxID=1632865 RepID=UPI00078E6A03|nr:hypothetical protein [Pirellula sp. SH-Sr6A]AMV32610.1 hypothetical protein VN12_10830 [Pirellula sp. SH-Sr6A]